jgi:two-component system sensor histidine kinase TorS
LNDFEALSQRLKREKRARLEAEQLLEDKSRALYLAMEESAGLTEQLKQTVGIQTRELLNAQRVAGFGTFIWNIEAELVNWSDGVYSLLKIDPSRETLSVERYMASVVEEDRAALIAQIDRAEQWGLAEGAEFETTHRIRRQDGELRWLRGKGEITEQDGKKYLFGALQDITELQNANAKVSEGKAQLEKRLRELEKTQKSLETARDDAQLANLTKSRFIAMISHEIRTPINGLLGTLSLLEDSHLDESQEKLLQVALASADNLRVLLNDVIDFARLETGDIKLEQSHFSIRRLAKQMIDFWQPQANTCDVELVCEIEPDVPATLLGDPSRLGQVLNNFLSNALKFTKKGSVKLSIRAGDFETSGSSRCTIRIEVMDTGIGIARDHLPRLFKEFSQVDVLRDTTRRFYDAIGHGKGAGLGLAICRSLVEQMGGKIGVTSVLGEGSTFLVRLPMEYSDDMIEVKHRRRDLQHLTTSTGGRPRALVAEDVPANQLVARMLLEKFGCVADIVNDGAEAVAACKDRAYDFVLMDVSMPHLDGVQATIQIRALPDKSLSAVPIIGVTAFAFTEDFERFYKAGMNSIVSKPVEQEVLYKEVKSVLSSGSKTETPGPVKSRPGAVDLKVVDALIKGFSEEQVGQVFAQVADDLDVHRRKAITNARKGHIAELGRSCHAIKGVAASFGGSELADLAQQIEVHVKSDDAERAFAMTLDHLDSETDAVLAALDDYANKQQAKKNDE